MLWRFWRRSPEEPPAAAATLGEPIVRIPRDCSETIRLMQAEVFAGVRKAADSNLDSRVTLTRAFDVVSELRTQSVNFGTMARAARDNA